MLFESFRSFLKPTDWAAAKPKKGSVLEADHCSPRKCRKKPVVRILATALKKSQLYPILRKNLQLQRKTAKRKNAISITGGIRITQETWFQSDKNYEQSCFQLTLPANNDHGIIVEKISWHPLIRYHFMMLSN